MPHPDPQLPGYPAAEKHRHVDIGRVKERCDPAPGGQDGTVLDDFVFDAAADRGADYRLAELYLEPGNGRIRLLERGTGLGECGRSLRGRCGFRAQRQLAPLQLHIRDQLCGTGLRSGFPPAARAPRRSGGP